MPRYSLLMVALLALLAGKAYAAPLARPHTAPRGHDPAARAAKKAAPPRDDLFPSERVAKLASNTVVSIDVNNVAYGAIQGTGTVESGRTATLATKHLTGFVFDEKGDIVTDSKDIEGASLIVVRFSDGSDAPAKVVGTDVFYGVGVVRVEVPKGKQLHPAKMLQVSYDPFKDIYPYDQGDSVVTIGYSGGYGGTVTYGIVSAIRNFRNRNGVLLPSVIQSDVVINSGNEGSPLFNDRGEVIAMHERRGGGGSMQNTTFFTPIDIVRRAAKEIIDDFEHGREIEVWHPWLGIKPFSGSRGIFGQIRQVTDDLKMFEDIPYQYWDSGVWIDSVYPESPAREFGLLDQDIIMTVQVLDKNETIKHPYELIKSIQDLELMVTTAAEGDIFVFGVLRSHKLINLEVTIGQHPGEFDRSGLRADTGGILGGEGVVDSTEYF